MLVVVYQRLNPALSQFFPKCPFYLVSSLKCPGCGSQRAIHQLLNLNILSAIKQNALFVLALPYIIIVAILEFYPNKGLKLQRLHSLFLGNRANWIVLVLIISFWIFRNIFDF